MKTKDNEDFFEEYVMIAWARVNVSPDTNAILAFSKVLDCLELPKTFVPKSAGDELKNAFLNKTVIKDDRAPLNINAKIWQLAKLNKEQDKDTGKWKAWYSVRDIPDIASVCGTPDLKKNQYYGILRADGDNMSKILETLGSDEDLQKFSATCFRYCNRAAELVGDFGGVTIFAGGDDLFALVPCEGYIEGEKNSHGTVFHLMEKIRKAFEEEFQTFTELVVDAYNKKKEELEKNGQEMKEELKKPSLSFGLFLSYEKYPLYEAVGRSGDLLFGTAKQTDGKNCTVVELQKHSGQSVELLIPNGSMSEFGKRLKDVMDSAESDTCLLSAGHKIALFRNLIDLAEDGQVKDLFANLFDSDFHLGGSSGFLHDKLPAFFVDHCRKGMAAYDDGSEMKFTDASDREHTSGAMALAGALRIFKFFVEKKGARDDV